jgi:Lar family restriction alleviation protein
MAIRGSNDDMYPCFGYAYREMKKYLEGSLLSTVYKPSDLFEVYQNARDNGHQYQKYILGEWRKQTMNLIEAIKYMKTGGKVTHEKWKSYGILYFCGQDKLRIHREGVGVRYDEYATSFDAINLPLDGWTKYEVEIKKCPFCGGNADIRKRESDYTSIWVADCSRCDCVIGEHFHTKEDAIDAWNKRA